jgi:hypothetical protein
LTDLSGYAKMSAPVVSWPIVLVDSTTRFFSPVISGLRRVICASHGRGDRQPAGGSVGAARRRLFRVTGIAGLAAVVLIFGAVVIGTRSEPAFDVPATEVLTYYRSPNTPAAGFRSFVLTVGLIAFLWFVVALTTLLRRAEGEPPWRSTIAMLSGVLLPALALSGSEVAAGFRAADLAPQIARYAFDEAHVAFGNAWGSPGQFRRLLRLGHRFHPIPPTLAGLAGHGEWVRAGPQPHQLDHPSLSVALRAVLAVGTPRGGAAHPPRRHRSPTTTDRLSRDTGSPSGDVAGPLGVSRPSGGRGSRATAPLTAY